VSCVHARLHTGTQDDLIICWHLQHFLRQEQRPATQMLVLLIARALPLMRGRSALTPEPQGRQFLLHDFRR
jgi:hypothetical protein